MIEFHSLFMTQIFLLCLMLIGAITVKTRIVNDNARSSMTDVIINVFLPCNILSSFFDTELSQLPSLGIVLVISLGIMGFSYALALILYKRAGPEQRKVLIYATIFSNASLLGNPVIESIYGLEGLPYVAAYMLPARVAIWTVGIAIFTGQKGNLKKAVFHPVLIPFVFYFGRVVFCCNFHKINILIELNRKSTKNNCF